MVFRRARWAFQSMLIAVTLIGGTAAFSLAAEYVSVNKDAVNLRSGPGTNTEIVYELPLNYPLKVLEKQGDWYKVEDYEQDKGWIYRSLVSTTPYVIVKVPVCNIRSAPSLDSDKLGTLSKDVILKKVQQQGSWIQVSHPEVDGWVYSTLVWP